VQYVFILDASLDLTSNAAAAAAVVVVMVIIFIT